nr:immunoglobulin light chain junction region [Macaca mulatta]MOV85094.1 immunoglobulin light chain junction region [Macaca mulatta]MOW41215.1 immunoglobulin light chain junction region [Macaca mulatta]MOW44728.1 immunoglobulin light chain junction region [Macaca mulatta]MOW51715.1 immunoglobulin light chain junction region [Macaca mulatta]
CMQDIQFPLTF